MPPKAGRIQLYEDLPDVYGNPVPLQIPEEVQRIRRTFLAYTVLGFPHSNKARWVVLIVRAAWRQYCRHGCPVHLRAWCRHITTRFNAIHADPEAHGADSDASDDDMW